MPISRAIARSEHAFRPLGHQDAAGRLLDLVSGRGPYPVPAARCLYHHAYLRSLTHLTIVNSVCQVNTVRSLHQFTNVNAR